VFTTDYGKINLPSHSCPIIRRKHMRTRVISIRLTGEEYDRLDEVAISRRMTIADMARELLRNKTWDKEIMKELAQMKEMLQEQKDMALDKGLRKTLFYAVRNGVAMEEMYRRLPGVSEAELSGYIEAVDKKVKQQSGQ